MGERVGMFVTTLTAAEVALFAAFGSLLLETVAVFVIGPAVDGAVTTRITVAALPVESDPSEHTTVAVPEQFP